MHEYVEMEGKYGLVEIAKVLYHLERLFHDVRPHIEQDWVAAADRVRDALCDHLLVDYHHWCSISY